MGKKQKQVLIVMAAVMLLMFIFPPFHFVYATGFKKDVGYGFVLSPPAVYPARFYTHDELLKKLEGRKDDDPADSGVEPLEVAEINYVKLLFQWVITLVVGGVAFFVRKEEG